MQMNSGAQNASLAHYANLCIFGNSLSLFNRNRRQMEIANDYILRFASILIQALFVLNGNDVAADRIHATANNLTVTRRINRSVALNRNRIVPIMGATEYITVLCVHIARCDFHVVNRLDKSLIRRRAAAGQLFLKLFFKIFGDIIWPDKGSEGMENCRLFVTNYKHI